MRLPTWALVLLVLSPLFFMGWLDDQKDPPKPEIKTTKEQRLKLLCPEGGLITKQGHLMCKDKDGKYTGFSHERSSK